MKKDIKKIIEDLIESAEEQDIKVEVDVLKLRKEENLGHIYFKFKDEDAECLAENLNTKRILIAIHQLFRILTNGEKISFDEALALVKSTKERFEMDYHIQEGSRNDN